MSGFDKYFSVLALFILFRETIEASIICSVLLQFLNRSKPALKKAVWWGVAGGVGVSIIFGVIFIAIFYTAKESLFAGKNRDWFKGIISWIAALLITILGFAMLRFLGWEAKWKRKLAAAIKKKGVATNDADAAEDPPAVSREGADAPDPAAHDPAVSSEGSGPVTNNPLAALRMPSAAAAGRDADPARSSSDDDGSRPSPRRPSSPHPPLPPPPLQPQSSTIQHHSSLLTSPTATSSSSSSALALKKGGADADGGDAAKHAAVVADVESGGVGGVGDGITGIKLSTDSDTEEEATAQVESTEDPVDLSPATRKENLNIWLLVFTTVVREGIESIVFLGGLGNVKLTAIPLPAIVGIICGCLVGVFLYYSGKQVKHIKWLVIIMAIIIFFIAAGQVSIGTDALMRAGAFGYCSPWLDERPWYMRPVYDWSKCCSDTDPTGREPTDVQNRKRFFALVRAIFGYQDKGTPTEIIAYCCYWGLLFIIIAWKAWRGTLLDADYKHTRAMKALEEEEKRRALEEEEAREREAALLEGGEEALKAVVAQQQAAAEARRPLTEKMCRACGVYRLRDWCSARCCGVGGGEGKGCSWRLRFARGSSSSGSQ